MWLKILCISFVATLVLAEGACKEEYTEWETATKCTEECGRCGTKTVKRTCLDGCQCRGPFEKEVSCPKRMCLHPKPLCCDGYKRELNMPRKRYECLSETEKEELNGKKGSEL